MPSDISVLVRRNALRQRRLARRHDAELPFDAGAVPRGGMILPDSTVYIDELQARLPVAIEALLARTTVVHCSVARAEIAFSITRLDPAHPRTGQRRAILERLLDRMPERRCVAPSDSTWIEGALLSGALSRLRGYKDEDRRRLLNDSLMFIMARDCGATLVSRNIADMDFLSAVRPDVKLLLYRI